MFNYHLTKLMSTGLMHKVADKWMNSDGFGSSQSSEDETESVSALDYHNLIFPFAFLAIGVIASAVVVLVEKVCTT